MRFSAWMRVGFPAVLLWAGAAIAQEGGGVDAGPSGFSFLSADGAWRLRVRGLLQSDFRGFDADSAPPDDTEWLLRRVRPTFEGNFGKRISFRLMPDFGGGTTYVPDAWVETAVGTGLKLRVGKFKPPVGLERLQSAADLRFVERGFVTELVPQRDVGAQISGTRERLVWQVGAFNGVIDGRLGDDDDDGKQEVAVRLFAEPLDPDRNDALLGIGIAATYGSREGTTAAPLLPGYRSAGQNVIFTYRSGTDPTISTGERLRVTPQFYWYRGWVGLLGEWGRVRQDVRRDGVARTGTLDHDAWQITGEWFLTGEDAGYRDPSSTGAVQLVARVGALSPDAAAFVGGAASFADPALAVSNAHTWGFGAHWFPLAGLKASAIYELTSFDGGAAGGDRPDERLLFLRLQLSF